MANLVPLVKLANFIGKTTDPYLPAYRNLQVFGNNTAKYYYFTHEDGKIEMRTSLAFDPAVQCPNAFRADKPRYILQKFCNERNIRFIPPEFMLIAYDIETYKTIPDGNVPQFNEINSHIKMISAVSRFRTTTERHLFLYSECEDLAPADVGADMHIHYSTAEAAMCVEFTSWVRAKSLEAEVILVGWNSSQQQYGVAGKDGEPPILDAAKCGYDLPWILARTTTINYPMHGMSYKGAGYAITADSLFGLRTHIVDMQAWTRTQFQSNPPPTYRLNSVLAHLKLPMKQNDGLTYAQMNEIMAADADSAGLARIARYCVYDSEAVLQIAAKLAFLPKLAGFMHITNIPISSLLTGTQASHVMWCVARDVWRFEQTRRESGATEPLVLWDYGNFADHLKNICETAKYTGAINWCRINYRANGLVTIFDFVSLYPNTICMYNISPFSLIGTSDNLDELLAKLRAQYGPDAKYTLVWNEQPTAEQLAEYSKRKEAGENPFPLVFEHAELLRRYTMFVARDDDPLVLVVKTLLAQRNEYKQRMKTLEKGSDEYNMNDSLQYCVKIMVNSLYGLLGSHWSCYIYSKICAAAVTAAARNSITIAAKIIEAKYGKLVFVDTDSGAFEPFLAFMFPRINPESSPAEVAAFVAHAKKLESEINADLRGELLAQGRFPPERISHVTFAFEKVFERALFAKAKTYLKLEIVPSNPPQLHLDMRGPQFTALSAHIKTETVDLFSRLLDGADPDTTMRAFCVAQVEKCIQSPALFAKRVKLSGKDAKAISLRRRFPDYTKFRDDVLAIRTRGKMAKTTEMWLPIDEDTNKLVGGTAQIDIVETMRLSFGNISRFWPNWRDIVAEQIGVSEIPALFEMVDVSEMTFRVEKRVGSGAMSMPPVNYTVDEVFAKIREKAQSGASVIHEYVVQTIHKPYFDIESARPINIGAIKNGIERYFGAGTATIFSACSQTKHSYHVVCQVHAHHWVNVKVAERLYEAGFRCVDLGVYSKNHCIRCILQPKIVKDATGATKIEFRRFMPLGETSVARVTDDQIRASLITFPEELPTVFAGLVDELEQIGTELIDLKRLVSPVAVADLPAALVDALNDQFGVGQYKCAQTAGKNLIRVSPVKWTKVCPFCDGRMHTHDGWYIYRYTGGDFALHCSRDESKTARVFKSGAKPIKFHARLAKFYADLPQLPPSLPRDQYLETEFPPGLSCIRAAIGSGKTERMKCEFWNNPEAPVVAVTMRRVLANDNEFRFNTGRPEFALMFSNYMNISGKISMHEHKRLLIQIDSLYKLILPILPNAEDGEFAIEYLVLDEIESILNQMGADPKPAIVDAFRHVLLHARRVIAMDGLLQRSTIKFLEYLTGKQAINTTFVKRTCEYDCIMVQCNMRAKKNTHYTHWYNLIRDAVANGKNVACYVSHKNIVESAIRQLKRDFPNLGTNQIIKFTGNDREMQPDNDSETGEVETHFRYKQKIIVAGISKFVVEKDVRVFLYTSTITAGVNIDCDHFGTFFHFIDSKFNPVDTVQALCRVRNFRAGHGMIFYEYSGRSVAFDSMTEYIGKSTVFEEVLANGRFHIPATEEVSAFLKARATEAKEKSLECVVAWLRDLGFRIKFGAIPELKYDEADLLAIAKEDKSAGLFDMCQDPWRPSDEELKSFRSRDTKILTTTRDNKYPRKHDWMEMQAALGLPVDEAKSLTQEQVDAYCDKRVKAHFLELKHSDFRVHGAARDGQFNLQMLAIADQTVRKKTSPVDAPAELLDITARAQYETLVAQASEQRTAEFAIQSQGSQLRGEKSVTSRVKQVSLFRVAAEIEEIFNSVGGLIAFPLSSESELNARFKELFSRHSRVLVGEYSLAKFGPMTLITKLMRYCGVSCVHTDQRPRVSGKQVHLHELRVGHLAPR